MVILIEKIKSLQKYIGVYQSIGNESLTKSNLSKKLDSYYGKSTVIEKTKEALDGKIPMVISKDDKVSINYEEFRGLVEGLCKLFGTDAAVLFTGPVPAPGGRKGDNPQIAKVPNKVENPQFTECKKKNIELKNKVASLRSEKEKLEKKVLKLKSEKILAAMTEPTVRIDTARIIGEDVREDIFLHNVSGIFPGERDRSKIGGSRDSFYKRDEDKSHQLTIGNGRRKIAEFLCRSRFFEKLFNDCRAAENQKEIKGEITPKRISENRKKSIEMLLKDGSLTNQAKLALYAGWYEYHGTEMEDLLNYAGDHSLAAEYVIRLLEMPDVANNYENVRGNLRQVCKASEVRMKRVAAKELIAGEWYVVAEYNNKPCRFQMLPMDELIRFEEYLKKDLYPEALSELDKLLGTYRKAAFVDDNPEKKLVVKSAGYKEVDDDYYAEASEMIHQYEAITGIDANLPIEEDTTSDDFTEYEEDKNGSK